MRSEQWGGLLRFVANYCTSGDHGHLPVPERHVGLFGMSAHDVALDAWDEQPEDASEKHDRGEKEEPVRVPGLGREPCGVRAGGDNAGHDGGPKGTTDGADVG